MMKIFRMKADITFEAEDIENACFQIHYYFYDLVESGMIRINGIENVLEVVKAIEKQEPTGGTNDLDA
jgi:hypothetical protein